MRIRLTAVAASCPAGRDVLVEAPAGTTVSAIADRLAALCGSQNSTLWDGSRALPQQALLGGPGLRDGALLGVGRPVPRPLAVDSLLHLAVVGGPSAGRTLALTSGQFTIGRAPSCDLVLADDDVSRTHLTVTVDSSGVRVSDSGSTNGTYLGEDRVPSEGLPLPAEVTVRAGSSTVVMRAGQEPPPVLRPDGRGRVVVVRGPRRDWSAHDQQDLIAPVAPAEPPRPVVQWLAATLPAVVGVGMAWLLHTWQFLAFAALTPLTVLATAASDRWHWRGGRRRAAEQHAAALVAAAIERQARLDAERDARLRAHVDAAAIGATAAGPGSRLWERRRSDHDAMTVRLGTANQHSWLKQRHPDGSRTVAGTLSAVPVIADLRLGPLGVAGLRPDLAGLVHSLLGQLAVGHAPADLDFAIMVSDGVGNTWEWLRWLPHRVTVAADRASRSTLATDLASRLAADRPTRPEWAGAWTLLIVDRAAVLAADPLLASVLQYGVQVGIAAICVDEAAAGLPHSCRSVAVLTGATGNHLAIAGTGWWPQPGSGQPGGPIVADRVDSQWADRVGRALAPLSDPAGDRTAVPGEVRWHELVDRLDPPALAARWRTDGAECPPLSAPIGADHRGAVSIDLTADGPHALIAGTTGSGKSELLQTLVAGLACRIGPEDLALLFVDYKGGATFGPCALLPHTLGVLTDLDPYLTRRVLRSLDAELRRREHLLAANSAADFLGYRQQPGSQPLPRLLIAVDEFATLAADLPDFVPGLVDIAQRGRSLGVHLVLATQRPNGVISPAIRANTTLRICLRVTDPTESTDVIGSGAAATISPDQPGRGLMSTGRGLTEFHTARVMVPAAGRCAPITLVDLSAPPRSEPPIDSTDGPTELTAVVQSTRAAWAQRLAEGASAAHRPWLPPLPSRIAASGLQPHGHQLPIGYIDRPDQQRQDTDLLDLAAGGTVLVSGAPRSGRTTSVRTVALAAAGCGDVAITIVDAAGTLASLAELPGVRGYVRTSDLDALTRLVELVAAECAARHNSLAAAGVGALTELPGEEREFAPMLLAIDGWEATLSALDELDAGRLTDTVLTICRDAAAVGLTVLLAGDRSVLSPRLLAVARRSYLLGLTDPTDYAIAGVRATEIPSHRPPGRAVVMPGAVETQFAITENLSRISQLRVSKPPTADDRATVTRLRLRPLPTKVTAGDMEAPPRGSLALGLGGDLAETISLDPWAGSAGLLVAGPPRSGRSNALVQFGQAAVSQQVLVWVVAPTRSPLTAWAAVREVAVLDIDSGLPPMCCDAPTLLLFDDADDLADTAVSDAIAAAIAQSPPRLAVVCAGRSDTVALAYRGALAQVRRTHRGLLLRPGPGDGDLLGLRASRVRHTMPAGRGLLVADSVLVGDRPASGPVFVQISQSEPPAGAHQADPGEAVA